MISQKLDLLMKITNTTNAALANALSLDASYIYRIRKGERSTPKSDSFAYSVAQYFASNVKEKYTQKLLSDAICQGKEWPDDVDEARDLICSWLSDNDSFQSDTLEKLISNLSTRYKSDIVIPALSRENLSHTEKVEFYHGKAGKQAAVEKLLINICSLGKPLMLLLCSDEDMDWLFDDKPFALRCISLLEKFISNGGKIKIIHTVSREIDEMLEAVDRWMPLYVSGAIEPYYCPKLRDNIFHRTLAIAVDHYAMISNTVGKLADQSLTSLIGDVDAVKAVEYEYNNFLALCKPLMQIFKPNNNAHFRTSFSDFSKTMSDTVSYGAAPSVFSMPLKLAESLRGSGYEDFASFAEESISDFDKSMQADCQFTDIISLPPLDAVKDGKIYMPASDIVGDSMIPYTPKDLASHLENVAKLLLTESNYFVIITDRRPGELFMLAKENGPAMLTSANPPSATFLITEHGMSSAFNEYLSRICQKPMQKRKAIRIIGEYIRELKK